MRRTRSYHQIPWWYKWAYLWFNWVPKSWKIVYIGVFYEEYLVPSTGHSVIVERKTGEFLWR